MRRLIVSNHNILKNKLDHINDIDTPSYFNTIDLLKDNNIPFHTRIIMLKKYVLTEDERRIFNGKFLIQVINELDESIISSKLKNLTTYKLLNSMFKDSLTWRLNRYLIDELNKEHYYSSIRRNICIWTTHSNGSFDFIFYVLHNNGATNLLLNTILESLNGFSTTELGVVDKLGILRDTQRAYEVDPHDWK